ncbi:hypothetical protein Efla_004375 [Eimeria flavescens]
MEQNEKIGSAPIVIPGGALYSADEIVVPPDCLPYVKGVLIPAGCIRDRVEKMAFDIRNHYKEGELHIVCLLKGARVFFGELPTFREVIPPFPLLTGHPHVSVRRCLVCAQVKHIAEELHCLKGKDVLLLDDIVERGKTLNYTVEWLKSFSPKSVKTACLLQVRIKSEMPKVNFTGFTGPIEWFVGYGIDYNDRFRDVPHICVLAESGKKAFAV